MALSTQVESNIVQVTGMDNGTAISIDGSGSYDYRICTDFDCSTVAHAYASTAGSIDVGEYVQLRLTSSASNSTPIVATVTVGTLGVDWSVTTGVASITYVDSVESGTATASTTLTVLMPTNIADDMIYVIIGATAASTDPSGALTAPVCGCWTQVFNDDIGAVSAVRLGVYRKKSNGSEPASYDWGISPASGFAAIAVTYRNAAEVPDVVSSFNSGTTGTPVSPAVTTTVANTMVLRIFAADDDEVTDPGSYPTVHTGRNIGEIALPGNGLGIGLAEVAQAGIGDTGTATWAGGITDEWGAVTIALAVAGPDTTPDAFDFTDQTDVAVSTQRESDIVVVNGMVNGTAISIDGAGAYDYRICNDVNCTVVNHAYASTAGSIDAGEFVQLRLTSSSSNSTAIVATLTVGTLAVDWSVTTIAGIPDLQQVHYRWRNDDGGEAVGFDVGDGTDGALAPTGTFDMNASTSGGRSYADGIAYHVTAPADSATTVTRVSGTDTNGIVAGDELLLINMQGTLGDTADVENYEFVEVQSVSVATITFTAAIANSYDGATAGDQKVVVQRVPNYTSVTLDTASDKITASAWDELVTTPTGAAGYLTGIVVFRANGTVSVGASTSIDVSGLGYGGEAGGSSNGGNNGESYDGKQGKGGADSAIGTLGGGSGEEYQARDTAPGTRGGGGGSDTENYISGQGGADALVSGYGAGGGGHGQDSGTSGNGGDAASGTGQQGTNTSTGGGPGGSGATTGTGGEAGDGSDSPGGGGGGGGNYGIAALTTIFLGSGGGGGGDSGAVSGPGLTGGVGGGIIFIMAETVDNNATIESQGSAGITATDGDGASGGGSGGSIMIQGNTVDNTGGTMTVAGGSDGLRDSNDDAAAASKPMP